jgi:hypothetical protein
VSSERRSTRLVGGTSRGGDRALALLTAGAEIIMATTILSSLIEGRRENAINTIIVNDEASA